MIYDAKTKEIIVINGQGPAPKAATPALFAAKGLVPGNGPLGATIPAMLDAMALALEAKGTMRLEQVMQPAIELADGFPMYEFLRDFFVSERKATEQYEWSAKTYYPNGRIPDVGEIFRQPNLARTLRAIVAADKAAFAKSRNRVAAIRAGRDAFYTGDIAHRIADADKAAGGVFAYDDLASFHGTIEKPTTTRLSRLRRLQGRAVEPGPGAAADAEHPRRRRPEGVRRELGRLHPPGARSDQARLRRSQRLLRRSGVREGADGRLAVEAVRRRAARAHRPAGVARASRRRSVQVRSVGQGARRQYTPHSQGTKSGATAGDTTCVDVVDKDGNLFSATPSSGWLLGGAFIAGDTGVPLSNRMTVFDLDPLSPNVLVGGKRPRTTLTPTIVLKDGKPFLAISTPGGDSQDQQILNVLLEMIVFGKDIQEAIEAPRVNSLHPFGARSTTTRASRACSRSRTACRRRCATRSPRAATS